jgi:AraC family transcriptional regulator
MRRVLKTKPVRLASDPSGGVITSWKHNPLDDVIAPMADHVIMTFPACARACFEPGQSVS